MFDQTDEFTTTMLCDECKKEVALITRSCSNCVRSFFVGAGVCGNVCRLINRVILKPTKVAERCGAYKLDEEDRITQCAWPLLSKKEVAYG